MKNPLRGLVLFSLALVLTSWTIADSTPPDATDSIPGTSLAADTTAITGILRSMGFQTVNPVDARDITVTDLATNRPVTLSSLRGKIVLLNFWATWCGPCRQEMPSLNAFYQRYRDRDVVVLAVDVQESAQEVRRFIEQNSYVFPVMLDESGRASNLYGIRGIPTTYYIDAEGRILGSVVGSIEWNTQRVFDGMDRLLNQR